MAPITVTLAATAETLEAALWAIHTASAALPPLDPDPPEELPTEPPQEPPEDAWTEPPPPPQPPVWPGSSGRVLAVNPFDADACPTVRDAMAAAENGDTIRVARGTPRESFEVRKILAIVGENISWDFRDFPSSGLAGHGRAAIVTAAAACTIEGFCLSGVGLDQRAAGLLAAIRNEAAGWLMVRNCLLHDNQNGLASASVNAIIEVVDTRLWRNGLNWRDAEGVLHGGIGHTHNIYVNTIHSLILVNVVATAPTDGHSVKTRGARLVVMGGIYEAGRGRCFDISEGGHFNISDAILTNPAEGNAIVLGYAVEGTEAGVSTANRIETCTLYLLRHNNAVLTEAGGITFADCTWHGNRLGVTGAGWVEGLP